MLENELLGLDNHTIVSMLRDEILDYEKYESGELKIIGYPGYKNSDIKVKDVMSFSEWVTTNSFYPIIKIEGLERSLDYRSNSIHLFYAQEDSMSFDWHTDDVEVMLYVAQGEKVLQFEDEEYLLKGGDSAVIPRGALHRANSRKNTIALSIEVNTEQHK
jgi:mannose-6-phosphate isomerase-like protein (cupin superfamily)